MSHPSRNVHVVEFEKVNARTGDEIARVLIRSDAHHDSRDCNRALEKDHLEKARQFHAPIVDFGDVLDVMQSRNDPRREHGAKLPEDQVPAYMDSVIDNAADFYAPYADLWAVMGRGNHETAVLKQLGTDLTERLVHSIREKSDGTCWLHSGGYSGYIRFKFAVSTVKVSKVLHYYHGSGGNAPVTRGAIKTQRMSRAHPHADVIATGHIHSAGVVPWEQWTFSNTNKIGKRIQWHVITPGYKDDVGDGFSGFGVERCNNEPRAQGACWLRFIWNRKNNDVEIIPELDIRTT